MEIAKSTGEVSSFASVGITGSSGDCEGVQTKSGAVDERDIVAWVSRGKLFSASFQIFLIMRILVFRREILGPLHFSDSNPNEAGVSL